MDINRRGGSRRPLACPLAVFVLMLTVLCSVCGAAPLVDRYEREPEDRDVGDGFVGSHRHSAREQELEPGDAVTRGDFTYTDSRGPEVEPNDGGGAYERADRRGKRLQNTIQEPPARRSVP
ncbi:MAG: hypothetical protein HQL80_10920 [Magnetococcales bacterium]|nr:hypothetical protein [Magnetococcales bacterium]